jgi:hypothetical protein
MRRTFRLSASDEEYLDSRNQPWETLIEVQARRVVIEGFAVPTGYNVMSATVALFLHQSYPDVQIDMAYFLPHLTRADGKGIGALSLITLDGRSWQRWSRHRVGGDEWRPGVDNIERHLLFVTAFLEKELTK